ncbi:hypothetical protein VCRA2123O444_290045 [Vibrio crassostreae]|nr:hypothetical protein VCRA2119O431_10481 [Vibrio crassostreae]CAK1873058.1 hypothetical protein VCRA2113O409_10481 [Vibrio crassostreae]CAK1882483.1 hypothetical protein VCRA2113O418_10481 [Vibrio crassostreae]CAK1884703.1 hypothetical protein VCRA2113O414_10481 [Vibrio crassostreae]CAK1937021.1 hypothetical protein VCRA2113O416_260016 [Vibrio crassostreae]
MPRSKIQAAKMLDILSQEGDTCTDSQQHIHTDTCMGIQQSHV